MKLKTFIERLGDENHQTRTIYPKDSFCPVEELCAVKEPAGFIWPVMHHQTPPRVCCVRLPVELGKNRRAHWPAVVLLRPRAGRNARLQRHEFTGDRDRAQSLDRGRDPSGDCVPHVRGRHPSSRRKTFRLHNAAQSNGRLRMADGSSNPGASDTGVRPDTSTRQPKSNLVREQPASP